MLPHTALSGVPSQPRIPSSYRSLPLVHTTSLAPRPPEHHTFVHSSCQRRAPPSVTCSSHPPRNSGGSNNSNSNSSSSSSSSNGGPPNNINTRSSIPLNTLRRNLAGIFRRSRRNPYVESPSSTSGTSGPGPLSSIDLDIKRLQAFDAYVAELSRDPVEDPGPGESKGLATVPGDDTQKASLLKCAALAAQATKYPNTDVAKVIETVDNLAWEVEEELKGQERYPMRVLKAIIHVMYEKHGFHGNMFDFYDDDNSYINQVLNRKTGLPITLSIVFMEIAHRVGLPMVGVNLPGHFMIRPFVEDMEVLVDAFSGEINFRNDAEEKLADVFGGPVRLDPAVVRSSKGVSTRRILQRMLNNIKQLYVIAGGPQQANAALRIIRLMRATKPDYPPDLRDEGLVLYALQRYEEAAQALTAYLQIEPSGDDAARCLTLLEGCREAINQSKSKQG